MTRTVFLHVGVPKSGTTYLQGVLEARKDVLQASAGLLFPGASYADQRMAARDVRGMGAVGKGPAPEGAWAALVEEIRAWPGDAVVSNEWLCGADPEQVRRIVDDLAPARVKVVLTVRDFARSVPSGWQQLVRNRKTWSWSEFLAAASADDPTSTTAGRRFWSMLDVPEILDAWTTAVPAEDVVVITVPPSSAPHDLLWKRFCEVAGIEPSDHAASISPRNESLGPESVELVRRLNLRRADWGFSRDDHSAYFKRVLANRVLAAHRPQESRLRIPDHLHGWVSEVARTQVDGVLARGVTVVGDLDELRPALSAEGIDDPAQGNEERLLDTAVHALLGMLMEYRSASRTLEATLRERDRLAHRVEKQQATIERLRRRIDQQPGPSPVRRAVRRARARLRQA